MINVTDCIKIEDENRGINEKCWIDVHGLPALFKKTQVRDNGTHTNAHYAEAFVSEMCRLINYKCADVDIAERNGVIGCISYSFLKEDDELIDLMALIQNIRPSFDSKKMLVPETNETYSIPLILKALEEETASKEEFNSLKKDFLKSCIIDSLIEHYDRNPSNIAVIRNNGHITLSPMFDNGTSLSVSVPKTVVQEYANDEEWLKYLRGENKSKIGAEGEKFSHYDKLLDYILSNYYEDVTDFINVIQEKLTKENISKILSHDKYAEMDDVFKVLVVNKLVLNVQGLVQKNKEYKNKYIIEQNMSTQNTYENLKEKADNQIMQSIIPEIKECMGCPQRNPYHVYSVEDYMFHSIEEVNNIEKTAQKNGMKLELSNREKKLIQWAILFNELGKPLSREEIIDENGKIRDTFRNYSEYGQKIAESLMEKLHFYETDKKIIKALILSHKRSELNSPKAIKKLINDIGKRNIDLYLGMSLAETNSKNPEIRDEKISELKILRKKMDAIIANNNLEIIKALKLKGRQIKGLGLNGQQIGEALNLLATFIKSDLDMAAYYDSNGHLQKYKGQINMLLSTCAKEIKKRDKKVIDKIRTIKERVSRETKQKSEVSAKESGGKKKSIETGGKINQSVIMLKRSNCNHPR